MRRKCVLILSGVFFSVFIFIYFMLNHSISNKNVSLRYFSLFPNKCSSQIIYFENLLRRFFLFVVT